MEINRLYYAIIALITTVTLQAQDDAAMRIDTQPATAQRQPTFFIESPIDAPPTIIEEATPTPVLRQPIFVPTTPQLGEPQTGGPRFVYYEPVITRPANPMSRSLVANRAEKRVSEDGESAAKRVNYQNDTQMD